MGKTKITNEENKEAEAKVEVVEKAPSKTPKKKIMTN